MTDHKNFRIDPSGTGFVITALTADEIANGQYNCERQFAAAIGHLADRGYIISGRVDFGEQTMLARGFESPVKVICKIRVGVSGKEKAAAA